MRDYTERMLNQGRFWAEPEYRQPRAAARTEARHLLGLDPQPPATDPMAEVRWILGLDEEHAA